LPRPVSVGIRVPVVVHLRPQGPLDHQLGDPVRHRRTPERPGPAIAFGDLDPPHWWREVTPQGQPIPALRAVVREIPLNLRDRLAIDASRALVGLDVLIRLPDLA